MKPTPNSAVFSPELVAHYGIFDSPYPTYPVVQQFTEAFDEGQYKETVALSNGAPIPNGLSLHVALPYAGPAQSTPTDEMAVKGMCGAPSDYLNALQKEIEIQGSLFDNDRRVEDLHLTTVDPWSFGSDDIEDLVGSIEQHFNLLRSTLPNFTISVNGRRTSRKDLEDWQKIGIDQIRIATEGVDWATPITTPRAKPRDDILTLLKHARAIGFRSIHLVITYGPPFPSLQRMNQMLGSLLAILPERISILAHKTVTDSAQSVDTDPSPPREKAIRTLEACVSWLITAGYRYIGADQFVRPNDPLAQAQDDGVLCWHPQGYGAQPGSDYVGLGAGAIGQIEHCYSQNAVGSAGYCAPLRDHHLAVTRGFVLPAEDLLRRIIIQELLCFGVVDLEEILAVAGISNKYYFAPELETLAPMVKGGLLRLSQNRQIEVTTCGRFLTGHICRVFDRYADRSIGGQ
jgi:oxygen-independent coproporphyrinogen-3 oxidase